MFTNQQDLDGNYTRDSQAVPDVFYFEEEDAQAAWEASIDAVPEVFTGEAEVALVTNKQRYEEFLRSIR